MAIHFFTVPAYDSKNAESKINQFISQNKVTDVEKHFVPNGTHSFWSVCITTTLSDKNFLLDKGGSKRKSIDYKEVLSPDDFSVYSELRVLRKKLADEEGVPAYSVFTNEQLSRLVTENIQTKTELLAIEGVGQGRVDKYAEQFFSYLKQLKK